MRLIDADALINEAMERYCSDCERRKGVKNGKWKIVYSIGDAPCRACGTGEMIDELEDAPTIEPERKKGKWIEVEIMPKAFDIMGNETWASVRRCNKCGFEMFAVEGHTAQYNFCPSCGADMRGEQG